MHTHFIRTLTALALLAGARAALADMEKPGTAAPEENPRAQLEEIQQRIAALEREKQELGRKAEETERLAQRREELAEFQRAGRERLQELDRQQAEIAGEEPGDSPARKAQRLARLKWIKELRALIEQGVAIQDPARLEKLRDIRDRVEDLEEEWRLVRGPQFEAAARLEELERHAAREGTQPQKDLLARIRALTEDDAVARRNEFDAAKARRAREKNFEALVQQYWGAK